MKSSDEIIAAATRQAGEAEETRKEYLKAGKIGSFILLGVLLLAVVSYFIWYNWVVVIIIFLAGLLGVTIGYILPKQKNFRETYKHKVITAVVKEIDPAFIYSAPEGIPQEAFLSSRLFEKRIDRYLGEDLVKGKVGNIDFMISEVYAAYESRFIRSRNNADNEFAIFGGIFVVANLHKEFAGYTAIVPDRLEKLFGSMGKALQSIFKRGDEYLHRENPEFEKQFKVLSSDHEQAKRLLTSELCNKLLKIKESLNKKVWFSFSGNSFYIAINDPQTKSQGQTGSITAAAGKGFFEANARLSMDKDPNLKKSIDTLVGILQIIEEIDRSIHE